MNNAGYIFIAVAIAKEIRANSLTYLFSSSLNETKHINKTIDNIMSKEKPNQKYHFKIQEEKLFKVIPKNINRENVEDYILKACEYYSKHIRQKERDSR